MNRFDHMPVEGVTYRVQVIVPSEKIHYERRDGRPSAGTPEPSDHATIHYLYDDDVDARCYERDGLFPGDVVEGPAIVRELTSTTFVPRDRRGTVGLLGEIVIA